MNRDEKSNFLKFLDENIRFDGRKTDEFRKIAITTGVSETAEGSAMVEFGATKLIAGVKLEAGNAFEDTPGEGVLMVGVELSPIASKEFESGPPGFDAIELARVTDRAIRESRAMDVHKLAIKDTEKVWIVNVDINVLNADGNLFDACSLAAMAAIKDAVMPAVTDGKVNYEKKTKDKLPLVQEPISVTVFKAGKHLVIDPTAQEVKGCDARLTIATLKDGTVCAMQKGGDGSLLIEDVVAMAELATKKAKELRKILG